LGTVPHPGDTPAQPTERLADVEVAERHERTSLALEPDRVSPGEELQRAGEPRAEAARAPRDGREAAVVPRVERDEPVVLAQVPGLKDDPLGPEERHAARASARLLVAQLAEPAVVLPPVASHADAEVEEGPHAEERLELAPGGLPDALQHRPALADDDALLGRALHEDLPANVERGVWPTLDKLLHPDGAR